MGPRPSDGVRRLACGGRTWLSALLVVMTVMGAALLASAQDAVWQVVEVAGEARLQPEGAGWQPLAAGARVGPGDAVETGDDGRARLTRAGDAMTLSPNSHMTIPAATGPGAPSILQRLGTLLFEIDSRSGTDRFRVETPYLAAVVKGTVFTVTVGPEGGALSVIEGLVEVRRPGAPAPVLVQPGATVRAPADQGGQLDLIEPNGGGSPSPGEPGGGDRGSRGDGRGNGSDNAGAEGDGRGRDTAKTWKSGFGQGIGEVGKSTAGVLKTRRGDGRGRDTAAKAKTWKSGFDPGIGDIGKSTDGFLKARRGGPLESSVASTEPTAGDASPESAPGNPNGAAGGNSPAVGNAGGGNPNAGGGNPNAGGGNPNAGGGNPNAGGGGNPNVGGGNPLAGGGSANAAGGNPNVGGGNPNAGGGNPNAGGGNPNAGNGNGNGNNS